MSPRLNQRICDIGKALGSPLVKGKLKEVSVAGFRL
jgi:hypothetical protein